MSILEKVIGPKSKYDKTLPYTFMAKIYTVENDEDLCRYYYGDTICSLVEYLDNKNFDPADVKLYALFRGEETLLDLEMCLNDEGEWLLKPELCRKLENYYRETSDRRYKGHVEIGECCYEDRDETII